MKTFTIGSLFDGSGTAPLAVSVLGGTPLWASEIEPYPIAVTKARFPNMKHLGDITEINGAEIEPVDVIVGGSPCQDLSVAGKQAGLENGTRSNMFYEMMRIIREMRGATNGKYPRFVVWENVPGAFSSNKGRDFLSVVEAFCAVADDTVSIPRPAADKTGRLAWKTAGSIVGDGWSFAWRVLDAQYWGVPQRRRRIFAVLDLGSERAGEILFERTRLPWDSEPSGAEGEGTPADAVGRADRGGGVRCLNPHDAQTQRIYDAVGVWPSLNANTGGGQNRQSVIYPANAVGELCARADSSPCIDRGQPFIAYESGQGYWMPGFGCLRAEGENRPSRPSHMTVYENHQHGGYRIGCGTLRANGGDYGGGSENLVVEQTRRYIVRRLTPTECARLQGFPDWWCDDIAVPNPTDEDIAFWAEVWETHRKVMNPEGKPKTRKQIIKWLSEPGSDSNEYKMWGNGMALHCMLSVLNGIKSILSIGNV